MTNKKLNILGIVTICLLAIFMFGCVTTQTDNAPQSSSGIKQASAPKLTSSVEQQNIVKRLEIVNSPTSTMWFYGLSDTGEVLFKSTVKGKVTSSGKRLEPMTQTRSGGSHDYMFYNSELLQPDGTYGSSDEYVYWFDYEGNYFQWNGKYILSTKPLSIKTPTINFQEQNESG